MKKIYIILLVSLTFGMTNGLRAQILNLNYQTAIPLGDSRDYISNMSFRGAGIDYHHFLTDRFAIGGQLSWNTYYKNPGYVTGNFMLNNDKVTITGDQFRYLNVVNLMASGRYFFTNENAVICPYAGMGIGTNWGETRLEVGHYVAQEKAWQFAVAPVIGCIIPVCDFFGFNIGAKYQYSAKARSLPALQHFGINIGFSLML